LKVSLNKDATLTHEDGRCECGQLLFRRVKGGIEIKCRRCKRVVIVKA
jgi:phage FluMu protein Com